MESNHENSPKTGRAVTVGTFDGVHRGHAEVLACLRRHPDCAAVTFDRHPLEIVCPEKAPELLCSPRRKRELLEQAGVEEIIFPFTRESASMSAADFMRLLRDRYGASHVVIGYDNTFGSDGRHLTFAQYAELGRGLGLTVEEAPVLPGISSSAIRKAVAAGDIDRANSMLGRPFEMEGTVEHGHALGRDLGFPTANLRPGYRALLPAAGVYVAEAFPEGPEGDFPKGFPAVVNIGVRPTLGDKNAPLVEAHIIGFSGDLYGRGLRLHFLRRLRDEQKFPDLDALKEAISRDQEAAIAYFSRHPQEAAINQQSKTQS